MLQKHLMFVYVYVYVTVKNVLYSVKDKNRLSVMLFEAYQKYRRALNKTNTLLFL